MKNWRNLQNFSIVGLLSPIFTCDGASSVKKIVNSQPLHIFTCTIRGIKKKSWRPKTPLSLSIPARPLHKSPIILQQDTKNLERLLQQLNSPWSTAHQAGFVVPLGIQSRSLLDFRQSFWYSFLRHLLEALVPCAAG